MANAWVIEMTKRRRVLFCTLAEKNPSAVLRRRRDWVKYRAQKYSAKYSILIEIEYRYVIFNLLMYGFDSAASLDVLASSGAIGLARMSEL